MVNMKLSLMGQPKEDSRHALTVMKDLGITFKKAVPQSLYDSWWFFDCVIPAGTKLPSYLNVHDFGDINRLVGHGLSKKDVSNLLKKE